MSDRHVDGPLQPGDRAPNVVLDAITRDGKIALQDFRGHSPILIGLYRGLHCPFCRRHIAALGLAASVEAGAATFVQGTGEAQASPVFLCLLT